MELIKIVRNAVLHHLWTNTGSMIDNQYSSEQSLGVRTPKLGRHPALVMGQ